MRNFTTASLRWREGELFSGAALWALLFPLIVEQLLNSLMGTVAIAAQVMTNILENLSGMIPTGIGLGPMAVRIGMFSDWAIRGVFFMWRFYSKKWLDYKVM